MLIKRSTLQDHLFTSLQINKQTAERQAAEIISNQRFRKNSIDSSKQIYYYYSNQLAEAPINLVIHKDILKTLAEFHFNVYRNKPYVKHEKYVSWLKEEYQ
jgi:hypothetical protein